MPRGASEKEVLACLPHFANVTEILVEGSFEPLLGALSACQKLEHLRAIHSRVSVKKVNTGKRIDSRAGLSCNNLANEGGERQVLANPLFQALRTVTIHKVERSDDPKFMKQCKAMLALCSNLSELSLHLQTTTDLSSLLIAFQSMSKLSSLQVTLKPLGDDPINTEWNGTWWEDLLPSYSPLSAVERLSVDFFFAPVIPWNQLARLFPNVALLALHDC
eukprot:TRINITY_DN3397_c0_g3_i1.p1 TRINITY_DN3397_c0_g3~~TRINITY_DN3397_c0_g3_i1.p1  ORF type:complete len:219 (+),score=8.86 TRINITY_DN3397_c0_g3_i1:655-1311(+)